jgi:PEGA domain
MRHGKWTVILVALLLSGCAALFSSKSSNVSFNSNPVGADIWINGARMGTTPVSLDLKKNKDYTVTFKKAGFEDMTCDIGKSVGAGWVILDVVGTGIVGVVIDAATGSWYSLDKSNCSVTLPADGGRNP